MSETLYRKYRPKNFSEIIGQAHIVRTLLNSIKSERIGQAYLFTGPRGTGKTSIARILAKTINCGDLKDGNPCEKCQACEIINAGKSLDIIEIDAASNTGVDNIRELRETVSLANASLKYKVYIIDEVHMLSTGAFNALLKTLEEPPAHVVFILATTEIHKVPQTIISRCQRFDFARLPIQNIIEKLTIIAKAEKVTIDNEALEMIAISAEGGMRDAESLLGQIISLEDKNITISEVEELLGATDKKTAENLAEMVLTKNSSDAIAKINELLENGYDLEVFNKSFVNYLRQLMIIKIDPALKKYFSAEMTNERLDKISALAKSAELAQIVSAINYFLEAQSKISSFILPQLPLEIAVIKSTHSFPTPTQSVNPPFQPQIPAQKKIENSAPKIEILPEKPKKEPEEKAEPVLESSSDIEMSTIKSNWQKLLVDIRPYNHSLSALLFKCQPMKMEGNALTLATPYDFYCERLNDAKNKLTVEEVFSKILKSNIHIKVELNKDIAIETNKSAEPEKKSQQNPLLNDALEIMGGKIVE